MSSDAPAKLGAVTWYELVITVSIGWFVLAGIAGIAVGRRFVRQVRVGGPIGDGWAGERQDAPIARSPLTAPRRSMRGRSTYVNR
jgi:hypothetical protein